MVKFNANDLAKKKCVPCEGGVPVLSREGALNRLRHLKGWQVNSAGNAIFVDYVMKNFRAAIQCMQQIAEIAEAENHHPDIHLTGYRKLRVELSTHAIGGLSENDFILAAKIDQLPKSFKQEK